MKRLVRKANRNLTKIAWGESTAEVFEILQENCKEAKEEDRIRSIYIDTDNGDGEWFFVIEGDTEKVTVIVAQNCLVDENDDEFNYDEVEDVSSDKYKDATRSNSFTLTGIEILDMTEKEFEYKVNDARHYAVTSY
jgi:hypothetical protein